MIICPLVSLKMEQEKEGLISTGWLSSKKGKFSKVLCCHLGMRGRELLADTGQGPGRLCYQAGGRAGPY